MKKYAKPTLISLLFAVVCWCGYIFDIPENMQFAAAFAAVFFSVAFLCFLAVMIAAKISAAVSPYRVFAITAGLTGLCVTGYAIYDIATDAGFFAGIVGILLLAISIPITIVLLLADFLVWKLKKDGERKMRKEMRRNED